MASTNAPFEDQEPSRGKKTVGNGQNALLQWLVLVAAGALLTVACIPVRPGLENIQDFEVGEPGPRALFAPFDFKVLDRKRTETIRREAEVNIAPTFSRIPGVVRNAERKWKALEKTAKAKGDNAWSGIAEGELSDATRAARRFWTEVLSDKEKSLLALKMEDPLWRTTIQTTISKALQDQEILLDDKDVETLRPTDGKKVVSWNLRELDGTVKKRISGASVRSVTEEITILSKQLDEANMGTGDEAKDLVRHLASLFVVPTLEFDAVNTRTDREVARAQVPSVSIEYKQGDILVRQGDRVTEDQVYALTALSTQKDSRFGEICGRAILVAAILWILYGYLRRFQRDLLADYPRLLTYLGQITFIVWAGFLVAWGAKAVGGIDSTVGYVVPVATIGILVTLLENSRLGVFSVLMTTVLVGIQFHWDFSVLLVLALTGIIAVYHVAGANLRSQIYLAWPWIVVPGMVVSTGIHLIGNPSWQAFSSTFTSLLGGWAWLAMNGFLSVGVSLLLLPLLEDMLGVTTEFKLRELSVSHPLLRRLEEVAPGTYYHSLNVSVLAEAAAASIGANALLVKVAAYYHDIGKMEKPTYFTENQFTEEDKKKHSKISPHMSCLIIRNHVKLGLEMAREYRLPEALLPFIAEHHGTTLISYFYDMARSEDAHGTVTESDFRYAGPKPQTIESAVMMVADTIEAASRSMRLVGEGEIRVFVKRMINDKMIDGQFDECSLTFKELHVLSESFTRTLKTMMHRRIAYPSTPEVDLSPRSAETRNVQALFGGASPGASD